MKAKTYTLLFCFLIFASLVRAQDDQPIFKVMTYNIYHGSTPDSISKPNLEEIANLIIQTQPEVIAFQEVDSMTTRSAEIYGKKTDLIAELSRLTGYRGYFAKAMDYAEGGYGEGLLVKKGSDYYTQNLPTPVGGEPRAAAWVKVELRNQQRLYFAGTHLCHQFPENRLAQIEALTSYADTLAYPVFWAGDLNFDPNSEAYHSVPEKWADAGKITGDDSPTYGSERGKRIDYVWFDPEHFEVMDYQVLDVPFSDHFPVLVTLKLIKP